MQATARSEERSFDDVLATIQASERAARRRAVLLTLVPLALGLAIIGYSIVHVRGARREVAVLQTQADEARVSAETARRAADEQRQRVEVLSKSLADTEQKLQLTADMMRAKHDINLADLKSVIVRNPGPAGDMIQQVLRLKDQNVKWNLTGNSPEQGFNSPAFAAFVLKRVRLIPDDAGGAALSDRVKEVTEPQPGDLAFYPGGTVMFFFRDGQDRPFVIGMTPAGIVSLEPDFAKPLRFGRVSR